MSPILGDVSAVVRVVPSKQVIFLLCSLSFQLIFYCPEQCAAAEVVDKNGNYSNSEGPTEQEKEAKNKEILSNGGGSDFWVGSHKLEFKPHPLLMPSSLPSLPLLEEEAESQIPIMELGMPSTLTSDEDLSESSSDEKKKTKRKSRDRRKKTRDQRRMAHRTLWANGTRKYFMNTVQTNPQVAQQQYYGQQSRGQPGPVILTAGQPPPLFHTPSNRNDESFHGTATTWNINHPSNNLQTYNSINSQLAAQESPGGGLVTHYPPTSSLQQFQLAYQQQLQQQQQQQQQQLQLAQPFPQHLPSFPLGPQSFPLSPSAPDTSDLFAHHSQPPPQSFGHSLQSPPPMAGNNRPILVYVTPGGMTQASGPIPLKTGLFGSNELPFDIGPKPIPIPYNHNHITEPVLESLSHGPGHGHSSKNPQYLRNNFIRMVMDRLASVGKVLPIPFVTKYSHHHGKHGHFNRRM